MNAPERLPPQGPVYGMASEVYHSIHAMSAGGLKRMRQSPAHFYGMQLDPNRPEPGEPTAALVNGTLVHCALFEPETVAERYVVKPEGMSFASKDGKAWRDAQTLTIVDADVMQAALAQSRAVRALPDVAALLADGEPEVSAFWIDPQTLELCKCRPDFVSPAGDGVILVDGKTCQDASPKGFMKAVVNFGYDLGAAWYTDGYERATGLKVYGFVFACVESTWPYAAAAYMLSDTWIEAARARNRELLNLYAECKRTGRWPSYGDRIDLLEMPQWLKS